MSQAQGLACMELGSRDEAREHPRDGGALEGMEGPSCGGGWGGGWGGSGRRQGQAGPTPAFSSISTPICLTKSGWTRPVLQLRKMRL